MEAILWVLLGIAIAGTLGLFAALVWLAYALKKGVDALHASLTEIAAATKGMAALSDAAPIFKKISEQGEILGVGMASLVESIRTFSGFVLKEPEKARPPEEGFISAKSEEEIAQEEAAKRPPVVGTAGGAF